ncbi:MAG: hypothetical protein JSV00_01740 [bacterium]|nr:MAG: hypothetical protein JSV00_01740 [bacterium]
MEEVTTTSTAGRLGTALRILAALQVLTGIAVAGAVFLFVVPEPLDTVAEEVMMAPRAVISVAYLLLALQVISGVFGLARISYGWYITFFVAALILLMGLLHGPRSLPLTRVAFFTMMGMSLLGWALSVLYYHYDLYS